jgi:hypothetical protein
VPAITEAIVRQAHSHSTSTPEFWRPPVLVGGVFSSVSSGYGTSGEVPQRVAIAGFCFCANIRPDGNGRSRWGSGMSARSVGMASMFGWIQATFALVKRNFGAMSVASLLNLAVLVLMMAPMFFVMSKAMVAIAAGNPSDPFGGNTGLFLGLYALSMLIGLLLMPPLMGGWFQLCENADRGAVVGGTQVLRPYSDIPLWLRLVGFALLGSLLYIAVFCVFGFAFRGTLMSFVAMQAAQNAAVFSGQPAPPPSLGVLGGIFLMYVVMLPVMFLLQFVYMVGMAEVSLRATPVLVAFKDAFAAVLRNSLKLLVFMFVLGMLAMVAMFVFVIVAVLVVGAASLLSKSLGLVLMLLLYIPLLLVLYPLMFAGNYVAWKSLLGSEPPMPPVTPGIVAA